MSTGGFSVVSSEDTSDGEALESAEGNVLPLARKCLLSWSANDPGGAGRALVLKPSDLIGVGMMHSVRLMETLQPDCTYSSSLGTGEEDRVSSLCPSSGLGARKFGGL